MVKNYTKMSNSITNGSSGTNSPTEEVKKKAKDSKNCGFKKCFSALVDRKQVNLELDVLRLMLRKELEIDIDSLEPQLANILPYVLVYYIKNWPGWQKSVEYYSGNIPFKTWYDKFYKFITLKLNEVITTHYESAVAELQKENTTETRKKYMLKKISDRNTQTENITPKAMAPFSIEIMAKPVLLNTLVFTDTPDGDIILKQHNVLEWDKLVIDTISLKQLITWPYVGIHVISPVFSFTRRNLHEFRRHISLIGTPLPSTTLDFIEEIKIIDPKMTRCAFTIDYLREMTTTYLDALKSVYKSTTISDAFRTIINEFLTDIEEIDIQRDGKPTIASSTSVLFNIGKKTYFRNKKLSKGSPSRYDIGYTEVIIPKMETALTVLSDQESVDAYINYLANFDSDNIAKTVLNNLPQITFSCSYCQKNFDDGGQMGMHLKDEHKMEQPMLCTECKQPFPTFDLSKIRWNHTCMSQSS